MLLLLLVLAYLECAVSFISIDLEPTSKLLFHNEHGESSHDGVSKGHRRLHLSTDEDAFQYLIHPNNSAVYASLTELDIDAIIEENTTSTTVDMLRRHIQQLKDFNSARHVSRYERWYLDNMEEHQMIQKGKWLSNVGGSDGSSTLHRSSTLRHRRVLQEMNVDVDNRAGLPPAANEDNNAVMYNAFQSAPLNQGYGTHYATLWVGTPTPQRKTLIVDTGSHHTAFPCKGCFNCGEEHHTDKYFQPEQSTTFLPLTCDDCLWGSQCGPVLYQDLTKPLVHNESDAEQAKRCIFSQSYTEGSAWQAYQVRDRVFCGGTDVLSAADPLDQRFAIDFVFGCQTSESGLFVTQLADGIMGMSQHEATLPRALYNSGKLERRMFALCFRKEVVVSKKGISAGVMTLGGIDTRLDSTPMVYAANLAKTGWYTVYVKNVFLRVGGGQSAADNPKQEILRVPTDLFSLNSGKGIIIDSGTTDTYLHKSMAKEFNEAWKKATGGRSYSNSPIRLTREELAKLPTILIQIMAFENEHDMDVNDPDDIIGMVGRKLDPRSPHDVLLAIPASHYMEYSPSKDVYTSRFYFTESRGGVLGANSLQGHDVLFDWENGRIGFSESTCKVAQPVGDLLIRQSEVNGKDCILREPALTLSCQDTVDIQKCEGKPADYLLDGMEKWAMIVESPAEVSGLACEEVIQGHIFQHTQHATHVECDESGLCTMSERCEITCEEAKSDSIKLVDKVSTNKQCDDNAWGACLPSCRQSKITSHLNSDGICHEDKQQRESRSCHVDHCARADPCLVPFLVHVILAFRGADYMLWDHSSEEQVVDAFTGAANSDKSINKLFEEGDVKILMTAPWYDDITDMGAVAGDGIPQGMKVVLEISIYNPNALYQNTDSNESDNERAANNLKGAPSTTMKKQARNLPLECRSADLYKLAQIAHDINLRLSEDDFMRTMLDSLRHAPQNALDSSSPFSSMLLSDKFLADSVVLSTWTIKTEATGGQIYDHQLDPYPGGFDFLHVVTAYLVSSPLLILFMIFFICMLCSCDRGNDQLEHDDQMIDHLNYFHWKKFRNPAGFCPRPVGISRNFGLSVGNLRQRHTKYRKVREEDYGPTSDESNVNEYLSSIPTNNAKYRSKLNSIINS